MTDKLNVTCPHCHSALKIDTEAEQSKDRLMEDKFNELLGEAKKSKDTGKPIRDIDLD